MLVFLTTLLISCGMTKSVDNMYVPISEGSEYVYKTPPLLAKYYNQYLADLSDKGVDVPKDLLNAKFLFADKGFEGSGRITRMGIAYESGDAYILFSNEVIAEEAKLKAVMYKVLTERMELGLTSKDSKILGEGINKFRKKDYKKLISLIVAEWERQFIVIELSESHFYKNKYLGL